MDPQQVYEESMRMARESHVNMVHIKWILACIALQMWGMTVYFLLKEIPAWWNSFNKKEKKPFTLEQMKKDLEEASRPRKDRAPTRWD
tara:strand:+ start:481 stop:744 length:264 start_codon:yes stop_codon:yes gene_type:complete